MDFELIDEIFDRIDRLGFDGKWAEIDALLANIIANIDSTDTSIILTYLEAGHSAGHDHAPTPKHLKQLKLLYEAARTKFLRDCPEVADELLRGLEVDGIPKETCAYCGNLTAMLSYTHRSNRWPACCLGCSTKTKDGELIWQPE